MKICNEHKAILFCILVIWLKTIIISTVVFHVPIDQPGLILFFLGSTLGFLVLIFGLGLFLPSKWQLQYYFIISTLLATVLYSNIVYYREFTDIITIPMLSMGSKMGDLSTSIFVLLQWHDIVYFVDLFVIGFMILKKSRFLTTKQLFFQQTKGFLFITVILAIIIISLVNVFDKNHLFNREQIVRTLGIYNYYIYDLVVHTKTNAQPVFSNESDWSRIESHLLQKHVEPNQSFVGMGKHMNVIVVSIESLESFVIGKKINGKEITPFLNELIEDSFYFENFYHQTGQGKTSDAEFLINNSLYPLGRGAVFLSHAENEFRALPQTLKNEGFFTSVLHANDKTFYNRDVMYEKLGYDHYFSFSDYNISNSNSVGWGLKDIEFFEQSLDYISTFPEPFYSTLITLTNHFPFHLDEKDHLIEPFDSESIIVNQYFPTVRYTDEALRIFVEQLKDAGLYDNTILVFYGDHYGIANSHYNELSKFLDKEITTIDTINLNRVPLIIHLPGVKGKTLDTISGQIDVMPTLLNLLGVEQAGHTMFGSDLFAEDREEFVVLRDGTVITKELIWMNDQCLNSVTGEDVPIGKCEIIREKGTSDLYFSDKIIYRDLFRFKE